MSRNHLTVVIIFVTAALLTGCAGSSADTASSSTPTQTASSAASPEPTSTLPVQAFGGECDNVLPVAEAASIVGADASVSVSSPETEWRYPLETAGGLFCTWDGSEDYLEVVSLPVDRVPSDLAALYSAPGCVAQYDWSECASAREHGGLWTLAVFRYGLEVPPTPTTKLDAVLKIAADRGSTFPVAVGVSPGSQTWALPECALLGEQLEVGSLLGASEVFEGLMTEGPGPLDKRIAEAIGSVRECGWSTLEEPFARLAVLVEPDAGWSFVGQQSEHAASEPVEIMGASSAVRTRDGELSDTLLMTDTVNILRVQLTPSGGDVEVASTTLRLMRAVG